MTTLTEPDHDRFQRPEGDGKNARPKPIERPAMKTFKVLSLLLCYPASDWLAELPQMHAELIAEADCNGHAATRLVPLFDLLHESRLIVLQENYVATFDRTPSHSLHLFEHIHGESRDRGSAMIDLLEEYWKYDFDASAAELPDYVPLFLEFLSLLPAEKALELLGDAVHVLATLGRRLDAHGSPYAAVFQVLEALSPVTPQTLAEPPVRDMDEAMERFGPSIDGVEPLLQPGPQPTVVQMPASRSRPST
jgi:nitrate reductase delta subunit